jgi:hypothetical protein
VQLKPWPRHNRTLHEGGGIKYPDTIVRLIVLYSHIFKLYNFKFSIISIQILNFSLKALNLVEL